MCRVSPQKKRTATLSRTTTPSQKNKPPLTTRHHHQTPPPPPTKKTHTKKGNIRRAEHFLAFLRRFIAHLADRMAAPTVVTEGPASFLAGVQESVRVDAKTLRCVMCV